MPYQASDNRLAILAELVRDARKAQGLTIDGAAELAPMSPVTWTKVERGESVTKSTYAGVERSLSWTQGSIDLFLKGEGGPPHLLPGGPIQFAPRVHRVTVGHSAKDELDEDLRMINELPVPAAKKLDLMRQYLRLVKEAEAEAREADETAEAG